jgi:rRNA maturation endonuclease Nob1
MKERYSCNYCGNIFEVTQLGYDTTDVSYCTSCGSEDLKHWAWLSYLGDVKYYNKFK